MANAVHLCPSHLRQLFKSETGVPLARYGRQLRLAEARELLRTTFLSVKEVAARVGVTGMSHFVRDFKRARPLRVSLSQSQLKASGDIVRFANVASISTNKSQFGQ